MIDPEGMRRGAGIGSLFSSIFSSVVPFVKGALNLGAQAAKSSVAKKLKKDLKRTATQAGLNVVADALQGKNVLQSSKEQVAKAAKILGQRASKTVRNAAATKKPKKAKRPFGRGGGKSKKKKAKRTARTRRASALTSTIHRLRMRNVLPNRDHRQHRRRRHVRHQPSCGDGCGRRRKPGASFVYRDGDR